MPFCHYQLTGQKPSLLPYPVQLNTLGDHLRKRRLNLGLLQQEVAEQLGVAEATIVNWERNHTSPEIRFIPRIIAFLGYNPGDRQSGTLGQRLVTYRRRMGLSQKKLALYFGIDPTTLARWERGKGQPSKKLGRRLEFSQIAGRETPDSLSPPTD